MLFSVEGMANLTIEHCRQIEAATRRGQIVWRAGEASSSRGGQAWTWMSDLRILPDEQPTVARPSGSLRLELLLSSRFEQGVQHHEVVSLCVRHRGLHLGVIEDTGVLELVFGREDREAANSLAEAVWASIAGQIQGALESFLATTVASAPYASHWMAALDVEGWRAVFLDAKGEPTTEADAVRWEQWFITGEAHVFTTRESGPGSAWSLGAEVGDREVVVTSLLELLPFTEGDSPANIHPVLLDLEEQRPHAAGKAREAHKVARAKAQS